MPWLLWMQLPWRRALVFGLAALVMSFAALLTVSPEARTVVADRLGMRGVTVEQPHAVTLPTAGTRGKIGPDNLGERVIMDEARARVGFPVLVPTDSELGPPDEMYVDFAIPGGQVGLVYGPRAAIPATAFFLFEFQSPQGSINQGLLGKQLAVETRVEAIQVNGGRGLWIEGAPHVLYIPDARGEMRAETVRLAGNVLLWEQGDVTLRLEGPLSKELALRIAASVR
jgi:hypothetical protein